jgi:hypothetical protein
VAISLTDVFGTGGIAGLVTKALDLIFPDPTEKAKAQLALLELQQRGELAQLEAQVQLALGQLEVNKVEAAGGFFRSGWRPAVGWICAFSLAYEYVARPLFAWASEAWWHVPVPPVLATDTLYPLLFGLLGLGAYRTVEKIRGATNGNP